MPITWERFGLLHAVAVLFVFMIGCRPAETEYALRDWIEMGPFTFRVEQASDRLVPRTSGRPRYRVVRVELRVDPDRSEPTKIRFDDFLNDMADGNRMIVFPALKLVDTQGHEFDGLVTRVSGETRWRADFDLVAMRSGMRSSEYFEALRAPDLRLRIKNLDRRPGQPAVAVIELE